MTDQGLCGICGFAYLSDNHAVNCMTSQSVRDMSRAQTSPDESKRTAEERVESILGDLEGRRMGKQQINIWRERLIREIKLAQEEAYHQGYVDMIHVFEDGFKDGQVAMRETAARFIETGPHAGISVAVLADMVRALEPKATGGNS